MNIDRDSAETWAGWFRCLGDASRVLLLNHLACERREMTVGELVDAMGLAQSTVSHHLKVLADTCFVPVERRGTASYYRINERCLECFPSAAELVMGRLRPRAGRRTPAPPWAPGSTRGARRDGTVRARRRTSR